MTNLKKILAVSAAMLALAAGSAFAQSGDDAIAKRIQPYGEVCIAGEECASQTPAVASAGGGEARSGEAVYGQFCTACHGSGILGAPKTGDTAVWEARLAAAGSLDELTVSAITGVGAMPPKGTCSDCSDDEIKAAIQHMSGL